MRSLQLKKNRDKEKCFVVEGEKLVKEVLESQFTVRHVYALKGTELSCNIIEVTNSELARISSQKQPHNVVAVVEYFDENELAEGNATFVLDGIRDPGNFGTILRTANWFGVKSVVCSKDCVDLYNPKVLRASMGAAFQLIPVYVDIDNWIDTCSKVICIMDMKGDDLFTMKWKEGLQYAFVFGNEASGVRESIRSVASQKLSIPGSENQESLNVGIAAAITMSELFKHKLL